MGRFFSGFSFKRRKKKRDNRKDIFSAQSTEFSTFKRNVRPRLNLGISQYCTGVAASVKPLLKLCCNPTAYPGTRKAKSTLGDFVLPVNGCPALCGFPSPESHSITKSLAFGKACKTPGKRAEGALGKMLVHFTDS